SYRTNCTLSPRTALHVPPPPTRRSSDLEWGRPDGTPPFNTRLQVRARTHVRATTGLALGLPRCLRTHGSRRKSFAHVLQLGAGSHLLSDQGCLDAMEETFQPRSEEHTSELQSRFDLVCRLL